jgi:hypothetical protein
MLPGKRLRLALHVGHYEISGMRAMSVARFMFRLPRRVRMTLWQQRLVTVAMPAQRLDAARYEECHEDFIEPFHQAHRRHSTRSRS